MNKQGPALRAFAIGLACLGMCVFAWGLRYKLSLYEPPHSIGRHMPAAKLLTGNERRVVCLVETRSANGLSGLAFMAGLVFSALLLRHPRLVPAFGAGSPIPGHRRRVPAWAPDAGKFIRPPPSIR